MRTRCAARPRSTVRRATSRLRGAHGRRRVERSYGQPARSRRRGNARVERQLPRAAARVRARRADDGDRRAREHLRAPSRAPRQPLLVRWLARLPHTGRRLNSGFMLPQYVAASLVSENKVLAHPASVDSIPTSAGHEDHVSMGNASASRLGRRSRTPMDASDRVARGRAGRRVPCAARARSRRRRREGVRAQPVSAARRGSSASRDIESVATAIRTGALVEAVEAEVGELA